MKRKQSEEYLGQMMRGYGYFAHKWRDRGFISCPSCHKLITVCPHCKKSLLLPKAETYPDFLVATRYDYVECKQGEESWPLNDVSPAQEKVLDSYENSWLFLVIGTGNAPHGKDAFLIPWEQFKKDREALIADGYKSVRYQNSERSRMFTAAFTWTPFMLTWERGSWIIPVFHEWWSRNGQYQQQFTVTDHT